MQKHLKKAFSSVIRFPKIHSKKKLNNIYNSTIYNVSKKEPFLTLTTDDIGFATIQNNKIDHKIENIKQFGMKPWEKLANNNIYSPDWTCNKKLIKDLKKSISIETKDKYDIKNIKNHKKFYRKNTEDIFYTYSTAKNYKFKTELRKKYPIDLTINSIISNTKNLCFNNYMIDLLKNERLKINNNEIEYRNALNKENYILSKDIKSFDNYKSQEKMKIKNLEKELINKINVNSGIFEIIKQKSHEHRIIMDEIKRIIKNILLFKNYAVFIIKLLGIENDGLVKCDLGEKIFKTNAVNEFQIEKIINKIYSQNKILFNKDLDDIIEELKFDPYKIYNVIISKENMILNLLSEKENINFERNLNLRDFKKEIEMYQNKYNNYMNEYILYLKEYELEIQKAHLIEPNSKKYEFHKYLINLFYEIKKSLLKENTKKVNKDILLYSSLVIPCLENLQYKESLINKLIKQMEYYEKNDKKLFSIKVNETKLENKSTKFKEERESLRIKEIERKVKIVKKINQIIITGKYKYNLPIKINRVNSYSKGLKTKISNNI